MALRFGKKEYLTVNEAAKLFGVSLQTIRNWDKADKLKAVRHPMNNYRLYKKTDIEKVLRHLR